MENGAVLQVRISHKVKRDIPRGTFYEMLRQAGIDEETFSSSSVEEAVELLRSKVEGLLREKGT